MLYNHVLVAVDLIEECRSVADHAVTLAKALDARLTLLHVVEPLAMAYGGDVPMDLSMLQQQQFEQAKEKMQVFAGDYALPDDQLQIAFGHPRQEIHRVANEQACDLIVVGSHGRHGLALLLGSTANDVLHGAPCDVIAVRLGKKDKPKK
ncbi:MAG: universal stress protein [Pseudomonadaceae bacterium]|nr:MAG: universal stress protein [Pseudomonadaceae bacterium]